MSEQEIEKEIVAKGKTAPRLTPDKIDAKIEDARYYNFPGTTLTVCCLVLSNGFTVVGESAAASPENFDEAIGRTIAYDKAREKIWSLEGYLLREKMAVKKFTTLPTVLVEPEHGMTAFIGTKVVNATPMDRKAYLALRGWELPANENPDDKGYLVEYTDKVQDPPTVEGYKGYVSWSPADVFEAAYQPFDKPALASENIGDAIVTGEHHDTDPPFS